MLHLWLALSIYATKPSRIEIYSRRLGQKPTRVLIREQQKRWGSCNKQRELRFNWRIVMAPLPLLDYVVAHELCHLHNMNHSREFWRTLQRILPNYKYLQQQLDTQGSLYNF